MQRSEILVVEPIGQRNESIVPTVIAGFAATDEQQRRAPGIEGVEYPQRAPSMLHAELTQMPMSGTGDA